MYSYQEDAKVQKSLVDFDCYIYVYLHVHIGWQYCQYCTTYHLR